MFISNSSHCREIIKRKPRPIIRTILQMKGYGFEAKKNTWFTGKKKSDLVEEVVRLWAENPEQVQKAIETIIAGGAPIDNAALAQEIVGEVEDIKKAEKETIEALKRLKDETVTEASRVKSQMIEETRDEIRTTIEKALRAINSSPEQLAAKALERGMALVDEAISKRLNQYRPIEVKIASKRVKLKDEVFCDEFENLLSLTANGINVRMIGPAGCGKTHVGGQLARAIGARAYAAQPLSAGVTESVLLGRMLPSGKGGAFEYHASDFISIYENGGLFLFDEMDAADPNVLIILNTALANNEFALPQRLGNTIVKRHPDFRAIAAMNTYGYGADAMYVGRNQLDEATLDRFKIGTVVMGYSEPVERSITAEAPWVFEWAVNIRKRIAAAGLRRIMSTRTMKDSMTMVLASGWKQEQLERSYFADWTEDEKVRLARAL